MSRILIAEDDIHIASFVGKGLRAAGYTTEHVADGETALMMARGGGFDMVVLDIGLPAMILIAWAAAAAGDFASLMLGRKLGRRFLLTRGPRLGVLRHHAGEGRDRPRHAFPTAPLPVSADAQRSAAQQRRIWQR